MLFLISDFAKYHIVAIIASRAACDFCYRHQSGRRIFTCYFSFFRLFPTHQQYRFGLFITFHHNTLQILSSIITMSSLQSSPHVVIASDVHSIGPPSLRREGDARREEQRILSTPSTQGTLPSSNSISSIVSSISESSSGGVSSETDPSLYFEELSKLVDFDDPSSLDAVKPVADLALNRVQQRLLDKHIKKGRLISAMSNIDTSLTNNSDRSQLHGMPHQRRIRTTLSFASKSKGPSGNDAESARGGSPSAGTFVAQQNERFGGSVANPSSRREQGNASATRAGHALLRR